jgi:hypothetical protein
MMESTAAQQARTQPDDSGGSSCRREFWCWQRKTALPILVLAVLLAVLAAVWEMYG